MSSKLCSRIEQLLAERKREGFYRTLKAQDGLDGHDWQDGNDSQDRLKLIDFSSNDYLGIARSGLLSAYFSNSEKPSISSYKGATGSRLLTGHNIETENLENTAAAFHKMESGLFYTSGYHANTGLIATVARRGDYILYDKLVHASMREGIALSNAQAFSFKHNEVEDLNTVADRVLLNSAANSESNAEVFVLCESIYSMDGDIAPLEELAGICEKRGWHLIVDEAHGAGLAGENGEGLVTALDLNAKVFATVITYGKALGCAGGMVLSDSLIRDYLINFSKPFIYSTGPSNIQVMAVQQAYELIKNADEGREKIKNLKSLFTELTGFQTSGAGAIIPWLVKGNNEVVQLSIELQKAGLDIRPIRYPTVAKGTERLRICLHTYNTEEEIKLLAAVLNKFSK